MIRNIDNDDSAAKCLVLVDLERLRAIVREVVEETRNDAPAPEFYSQDNLPPGMSRNAFLKAIRCGELPARARGKLRFVAREDFRAYVATAQAVRVRLREQPHPANDVRDLVYASRGK